MPYLAAVVIFAVISVAGCDTRLALPTYSLGPDVYPALVQAEGTLVFDHATRCLELDDGAGPNAALLWPPSYALQLSPARVFDERGIVRATEGDHVWLGVASAPAAEQCQRERTFLVFDVLLRNPVDPL